MIVRQSDAHAWAEALVGGKWRRFDPTAAVAPSRIERGLAARCRPASCCRLLARLDGGWLKDVRLAWDAVNHEWRRNVVGFNYRAPALAVARLEARQLRAVADRRRHRAG